MINYLSKEDLPEFLQGLVDIMGIEAFINLIKEYGGSSLYIPNENSVLKPIRNRLIKKHFNGNNYKELAKEFKISEMQVRNKIIYTRKKWYCCSFLRKLRPYHFSININLIKIQYKILIYSYFKRFHLMELPIPLSTY